MHHDMLLQRDRFVNVQIFTVRHQRQRYMHTKDAQGLLLTGCTHAHERTCWHNSCVQVLSVAICRAQKI